MKKLFYLLMFGLLFFKSNGQILTDQKIQRLSNLGITLDSISLIDKANYGEDLLTIIEKDRKNRKNLIIGYTILGTAVATTVYGAKIFGNSSKESEGLGEALGQTVGAAIISMGLIQGGISIPFFTSAKKRKRERDDLIKKIQEETTLKPHDSLFGN